MRYISDLSDIEYALINELIPKGKTGGRKRSINIREVLNGIFYLLKTGCQWRMLPKDLPPWGTVHYYFRRWKLEGIWFKISEALRKMVRVKVEKDTHPTVAYIDSQSVKTTEKRDPILVMTATKR